MAVVIGANSGNDITASGNIQSVSAYITGVIKDSNNSAGTNGQVLTSTGSGTNWSTPSGGISSGKAIAISLLFGY